MDSKLKIKKKSLIIKSRINNLFARLKFLFYFFSNFLYYKKGIYLKGTTFTFKISKRKTKF